MDPNIIYVGTAKGSVWRSTDGGALWDIAKDDLLNPSVGAVAVHPTLRHVWIGTSENGGSDVPGTSFVATGTYLWHSEDWGVNWIPHLSFPFLPGAVVMKIAFDSRRPMDVYVATTGGLYKSTDYGLSFAPKAAGAISDVVILSEASQAKILIANQGTGRVLLSTDGGGSFNPTMLTGAVSASMGRMQFAQFPLFPQIVYVSVANRARF